MTVFSAVRKGQEFVLLVKVFPPFADGLLQRQLPEIQDRVALRLGLLLTGFFNEVVELAQEGDDASQEGVELHVVEPMILGPF